MLWLRQRELEAIALRQTTRIAVEVGGAIETGGRACASGDPRELRGLPVVGVRGGFGGAIPGTRPGVGLD